ncbi:lipopolysaccharide biosynthesis protein [Novosphingobium colocasiae]
MTTAAPSAPAIAAPLLWSTLASLGTQVLGFGTFAILARLLGAQTFGLVALAALVIDLLLVISTAGINEAVIQRRHLDEVDADTAFWGNLAMGTAFCIATIAGAPLIATAFHQPALSQVIMALAAIFAITPLGAIHTARLTRDLRFRAVASRNLIAALAGAIAGIPLAFLGFGVWALVAQRIASTAALVLASWWSYPWLPRLRWHRQSLIEMVRFGAYLGASRTLNQLNIRAAEMISGALVGPVAVAFIRAGSRVVEVVNQVTYMPVQQIAMPILTRVNHDPAALREAYLKLSRLSAFLMFPAFFGCLAIAPLIVQLVFGPGWEPVADALRIFTLAVVASQINNLIVAVIAALGESRAVLSWTGGADRTRHRRSGGGGTLGLAGHAAHRRAARLSGPALWLPPAAPPRRHPLSRRAVQHRSGAGQFAADGDGGCRRAALVSCRLTIAGTAGAVFAGGSAGLSCRLPVAGSHDSGPAFGPPRHAPCPCGGVTPPHHPQPPIGRL